MASIRIYPHTLRLINRPFTLHIASHHFTSLHLQELRLGFGCCALQRLWIQVSPLWSLWSPCSSDPTVHSPRPSRTFVGLRSVASPRRPRPSSQKKKGPRGATHPWAVLEFHTHGPKVTKVTKVQCAFRNQTGRESSYKETTCSIWLSICAYCCTNVQVVSPLIHMVALCSTHIFVLSMPDHCLHKPAEELPK